MTSLPASRVAETLLPPGRWAVDGTASAVRFRIRHLGVATVKGRFADVSGTIAAGPGDGLDVSGAVAVASIDTGDATRDDRLRSPGFFDADAHPLIAFAGGRVRPLGDGGWTVAGELTMMGETRPLTLVVSRAVVDGDGVVLRADGALSRREHGLDWPGLKQAGRNVVGDRVAIELEIVARRAG